MNRPCNTWTTAKWTGFRWRQFINCLYPESPEKNLLFSYSLGHHLPPQWLNFRRGFIVGWEKRVYNCGFGNRLLVSARGNRADNERLGRPSGFWVKKEQKALHIPGSQVIK